MTTRQTGPTFMIALAAMKTLLTISSLILFAAVALAEEPQDTANHLEATLANLNPANPDLPVNWTPDNVSIHEDAYSAQDHASVFICASRLF